jgi:hypothetical protein
MIDNLLCGIRKNLYDELIQNIFYRDYISGKIVERKFIDLLFNNLFELTEQDFELYDTIE